MQCRVKLIFKSGKKQRMSVLSLSNCADCCCCGRGLCAQSVRVITGRATKEVQFSHLGQMPAANVAETKT